MKTLQIKEAIVFGWRATTKNFWLFAGIVLVLFIVSNISGRFGNDHMNQSWVLGIIGMLASVYVRAGFANVSLRAADGKELKFDNLFAINEKYWVFLGATILFMLAVGFGTVLFIIPGIMIAMAWMMYSYIVIDKQIGVWDALKESARITKGYRWTLFGFVLLLALINLAGAILFGIGLFWTIPTTSIALAHMYRQLV